MVNQTDATEDLLMNTELGDQRRTLALEIVDSVWNSSMRGGESFTATYPRFGRARLERPDMKQYLKTEVLVVGGGPAGSTVAGFLARAGVEVTVVEREIFPRYHIGESLLPSCLEILTLLGARELIESYGFQKKPGAYLEWMGEQWSLDFGELRGNYQYAFQVPRAEFDHLLLKHARSQGARVLEGIRVTEILFDGGRPFAAVCAASDAERAFEIHFHYLVDASGRAGIMSTRYLRNRQHHSVFKNVAVWGYWDGARKLDGRQAGAIAVGSIPDGWVWGIPFSDGQMSVGAVFIEMHSGRPAKVQSVHQIYL